jgi:hypothetical protein
MFRQIQQELCDEDSRLRRCSWRSKLKGFHSTESMEVDWVAAAEAHSLQKRRQLSQNISCLGNLVESVFSSAKPYNLDAVE